MKRIDVLTRGWQDYELLDSGRGRKLERFGDVLLDRPDPQALWNKNKPDIWLDSQAQFLWAEKGERWKISKGLPESWTIKWGEIKMSLSLKGFKHVGIFPEHNQQWLEIQNLGKSNPGSKMLNLFGYTGAASLVGAISGLSVTHVDASKTTIETLKENAKNSKIKETAIRVVCEDALKYVKRLVKREEKFDIIVLDPPAFGRGPKGEIWKIEESLVELVSFLPKIASPKLKLVLINGYASGYSARTFGELLAQNFGNRGGITYGDISIEDDSRALTTGIYAKWSLK